MPGVQELVEAHRAGTPSIEQVRALLFDGPQPYQLLLGLRRHRDWAVVRPRSFLAALDSLRRTFTAVVADIDADVEGEDECGSIEVEERNVMARTVAEHADVVVVTGLPGVKGLRSLVRTIAELPRSRCGARARRARHQPGAPPAPPAGRADPRRRPADRAAANADGRLARHARAAGRVPSRAQAARPRRTATACRCPTSSSTRSPLAVDAVLDRLDDGSLECATASAVTAEQVVPGSLGTLARQRGHRMTRRSTAPGPPLVEIERRVQDRAKIDRARHVGRTARRELRALIDDEIRRWQGDYKRGLRPFDLPNPEIVGERAFRNLAGYGPLAPLLDDPDVWEIMINSPGRDLREASRRTERLPRRGLPRRRPPRRACSPRCSTTRRRATASSTPPRACRTPSSTAAPGCTSCTATSVAGGHVMVNIRKFTGVPFRSLDELVEREMLSPQVADFLQACVRANLSIIFAGAPGSGKTTLLSCCAAELDPTLARGHRRRGLRARRRRCRTSPRCRPAPGGPIGRPSTSGGWSPASSAWLPTSPSSVRSATVRRYRVFFTHPSGL